MTDLDVIYLIERHDGDPAIPWDILGYTTDYELARRLNTLPGYAYTPIPPLPLETNHE